MAGNVAKQRFVALTVKEVSLVGSPANEEEFITVKSAEGGEAVEKAQPRDFKGAFDKKGDKGHSGAPPIAHAGTHTVASASATSTPKKPTKRQAMMAMATQKGLQASALAFFSKTIKDEETDMADKNAAAPVVKPVAKDKAVGDTWMPMCMGKSCDSYSNICRACPVKQGCAELCHMNVPPDEPNMMEGYQSTPSGSPDPAMFPTGGQQTTKEEKPVTTPTTTAAPAAPAAAAPATATQETEKAVCPTCKGGDEMKTCKGCDGTGKVPGKKVEKEEPASQATPPAPAPASPAATATAEVEKGKPQFSEERMAELRKALESVAGIYKAVDPEGFAKIMSGLGGAAKPLAPTSVPSPVQVDSAVQPPKPVSQAVTKEEMTAEVSKALAPFKDMLDTLNKKVEEVGTPRPVSKALQPEVTEKPVEKGGSFWKGVL